MNPEFSPRFVKKYANLAAGDRRGRGRYREEVRGGAFPSAEYTFGSDKPSATRGPRQAVLRRRARVTRAAPGPHRARLPPRLPGSTPGRTAALVPTMGYLHEGHTSLIRAARQAAPTVAATIFVNPAQFAPHEDLQRYPRDLDGDLRKCEAAGASFVFAPSGPEEMYPSGFQTYVDPGPLAQPLCGASRRATSAECARWSPSCSRSRGRKARSSARRTTSSWSSSGAMAARR